MRWIRVVNWDKFQHYGKRRAPPWIRLYNSLLDNYEWGRLSDSGKAHLIGLYLLASRHDNVIPADPEWIAKRIQARSKVNLDELFALGFLGEAEDASMPLPACPQSASLEESRVEKIRKEERVEESEAPKPPLPPAKREELDFTPARREPTPGEVAEYALSVGYPDIHPEDFLARYRAVGWMAGRTPIADWRPLVVRWRNREERGRKGPHRRAASTLDVGKRLMVELARGEGLLAGKEGE